MRKSNKAKRADKLRTQHAKAAAYSQEIKARPATWAARMPAYCYTELCPDPALRRAAGEKGVECCMQCTITCNGRCGWIPEGSGQDVEKIHQI